MEILTNSSLLILWDFVWEWEIVNQPTKAGEFEGVWSSHWLKIFHAFGVLYQFMFNPGEEHWQGVKSFLCYFKGTLSHCLEFVSTNEHTVELSACAYFDWTGDNATRKYSFMIGNWTNKGV